MADAVDEDSHLLGHLLSTARRLAAQLGLAGGYRVIINCGPDGGQSVDHLHLHVLPKWIGDTNFMTSVGETRVQPEELTTTYERLRGALGS